MTYCAKLYTVGRPGQKIELVKVLWDTRRYLCMLSNRNTFKIFQILKNWPTKVRLLNILKLKVKIRKGLARFNFLLQTSS